MKNIFLIQLMRFLNDDMSLHEDPEHAVVVVVDVVLFFVKYFGLI